MFTSSYLSSWVVGIDGFLLFTLLIARRDDTHCLKLLPKIFSIHRNTSNRVLNMTFPTAGKLGQIIVPGESTRVRRLDRFDIGRGLYRTTDGVSMVHDTVLGCSNFKSCVTEGRSSHRRLECTPGYFNHKSTSSTLDGDIEAGPGARSLQNSFSP